MRVKRKGKIVYQQSRTFDRKALSKDWAAKLELQLQEPDALDQARHRGVIYCYFRVVFMYSVRYTFAMNEIYESDVFSQWLSNLKDPVGIADILRRIKRARSGNFGDHKAVGDNVSEMRLFTGPGYRLYFTVVGGQVYWLLVGGDKSTQENDIKKAKEMAAEMHGTP